MGGLWVAGKVFEGGFEVIDNRLKSGESKLKSF